MKYYLAALLLVSAQAYRLSGVDEETKFAAQTKGEIEPGSQTFIEIKHIVRAVFDNDHPDRKRFIAL